MDLKTIFCFAFFICAFLVCAVSPFLPKRGGWDNLNDFIMIIFIVGLLGLGSCVFGFLSWNTVSEWRVYLRICTIIAAVPTIGASIMAILVFNK